MEPLFLIQMCIDTTAMHTEITFICGIPNKLKSTWSYFCCKCACAQHIFRGVLSDNLQNNGPKFFELANVTINDIAMGFLLQLYL